MLIIILEIPPNDFYGLRIFPFDHEVQTDDDENHAGYHDEGYRLTEEEVCQDRDQDGDETVHEARCFCRTDLPDTQVVEKISQSRGEDTHVEYPENGCR